MMSNAKLAIALSITPWALGACAHQEAAVAPAPVAVQAAPAPRAAAAPERIAMARLPQPDRGFVVHVAATNQAAIRFGELAANRGSTVELRSLGREMVDTHTALSEQLRTSARTEGITLPPAQMTPRQQAMYEQLAMLAGPQFDQAFERAVIELQREAIANFENEIANGRVSELAMLANQALPLIQQRARTVQNQMRQM
jgi:predicted outer membrane protein